MAIELRTGLPGAGKTLSAVVEICRLREKEPDRLLFVVGITDLKPGLANVITADWLSREVGLDDEERRDENGELVRMKRYGWEELPPKAIVLIDECQQYMPAMRGGHTPGWIRKLSTHRHLGIDFVLLTQHPALIDSYVRRLVERHVHLIRKYGTKWCERLTWTNQIGDPDSKTSLKALQQKDHFIMPRKAMTLYKSAEVHTVKPRLPRRLFLMLALLVGVPVLAWVSFLLMHHAGQVSTKSVQSVSSEEKISHSSLPSSSSSSGDHVLTPEEWAVRQLPRVEGLPWSAPIYDKLEVQGVPDILCVIFPSPARPDDCKCFTEQVTPMRVPFAQCQTYAHDGVYNPYRKVEPLVASRSLVSSLSSPEPAARFAPQTDAGPALGDSGGSRGLAAYNPSVFLPSGASPDRDLSSPQASQ